MGRRGGWQWGTSPIASDLPTTSLVELVPREWVVMLLGWLFVCLGQQWFLKLGKTFRILTCSIEVKEVHVSH